MALKYLYCLVELSVDKPYYSLDLQKKFSLCHMPLDSIMLEWIRRKEPNVKKKKIGAWSNMCDFENWKEMTLILAAEEFLKNIDDKK